MTRTSIAAAFLLVAPNLAFACDMAEKLRLTEEQKKLAARNAWSGVERQYELLRDTKCELSYDNEFLGAESARMLGKVYEQYERLKSALSVAPAADSSGNDPDAVGGPGPGILDSLEGIDAAYARVEIVGDPRRRPVLTREEMPFAPDQRKAIEWAMTVVAETGSFKGMLPLGAYVVGEVPFTVVVSPDWNVVTVGKVKHPAPTAEAVNPDAVAAGGTDTQSAVRYASLIATAGPGFFTSPESTKPATMDYLGQPAHQFAPSDVNLSGFGVQLGGEVGLTYAEPALGLAMTLGYQGGFGTSTFNAVSGWLAGVVRPGDLRVAVGPMYQVSFGSGTGVASWFDRQQDPSVKREDLKYAGLAWGGGAQASIGYGLLDLEPLQGVVELGGAWQSDGVRNYFTFALRVGLVPAVPRFDG
ncbi:MAG: hypothetical protein ABMB14_29980 [Myxococcota bacterium]